MSDSGLPRLVEVGLALGGLFLAAPLLLIIAALVAVSSPGSVLFRQERMGRGGRPFTLFKFRTMRQETSGPGVTAADDTRMTRVGRFLRKWKLDELPELWNVLRGEMGLVGPRPEVPAYVDLQDRRWQEVLATRPGLTDPVTLRLRNEEEFVAGVSGCRETFYRQTLLPYKLRGYREYLSQRTWKTDLAVLAQSLARILVPGNPPSTLLEDLVEPRDES